MATIKEAVENAIAFAVATLGQERTVGLQLEEVATMHFADEDAWLITLSMPTSGLAAALSGKRDYKTFTVVKRTGEVTAMKIRELATT